MADAKATSEAKKLAEQFVKANPNHPATKAYLQSLQKQGVAGQIRARQLMEQGVGQKAQPKTKPLPRTVAAQVRAQAIPKPKKK